MGFNVKIIIAYPTKRAWDGLNLSSEVYYLLNFFFFSFSRYHSFSTGYSIR